mgnify:CR=1 FL=1|tara:strand:- start:399 stop:566 length:168 start_codon:yes stop_codon:yes gene_type:complete
MTTENLITNLKDGDNVAAQKSFNDIMSVKLTAAIDAKKIEIAGTIGNKQPEAEQA